MADGENVTNLGDGMNMSSIVRSAKERLTEVKPQNPYPLVVVPPTTVLFEQFIPCICPEYRRGPDSYLVRVDHLAGKMWT